MSSTTRRNFLKTGLAAGAMATTGILPLVAAKRTANDTVVLGRSKIEVTRLAFGTGTNSGAVQAALGQQEFTRLIRYAYDRGIRFFETAEAYETPGMLGEALKGLPREVRPRMAELAERLQIQHHSTVELVNRLAAGGFVKRERGVVDRREVLLSVTPKGERVLKELSLHHREELRRAGPTLLKALQAVMTGERGGRSRKTSARKKNRS